MKNFIFIILSLVTNFSDKTPEEIYKESDYVVFLEIGYLEVRNW